MNKKCTIRSDTRSSYLLIVCIRDIVLHQESHQLTEDDVPILKRQQWPTTSNTLAKRCLVILVEYVYRFINSCR